MRRQRRGLQLLALILGLSMIAAACGDDDDDASSEGDQEADVATQEGGDLVLGAEQEPDCMAWTLSCSGASWGFWTAQVNTMPRAFDIVKQDDDTWDYEPSILLNGEPEIELDPEQVVTYSISDDAVWSDGEPIVCQDFVFTWDHVKNGADIYDRTGFVDIGSVDCTDDKTPVVTYENPYAGWKQLFGGQFGILPSHILEGQDIEAAMGRGYEWSGGPWVIDSWTPGTSTVLVPNENWWGDPKPTLDTVTFQLVADTSAEFESFKAGETKAIYPQPQLDAVEQIAAGIEGTGSSINADSTPNLEALWINNEKPPFDSQAVRQAFAYSLDRNAVVEALFGELGITEASQSFNATILGDFGDPQAFAGYEQDLDQVDELMEGDGWAKGDDGIWAKGGQRAAAVFRTTEGNARRELTQDVIREQAAEAGFEITIDNLAAGDLFGQALPQGDFQLALYAQVLTSLEPSVSSLFLTTNIPTAENEFSGQNWTRTNIPDADEPLTEVDRNPDAEERSTAMADADALLAEDATSIPLDPLPNLFLWSNDIVGPQEGEDNPIFGPFADMHTWALAAS